MGAAPNEGVGPSVGGMVSRCVCGCGWETAKTGREINVGDAGRDTKAGEARGEGGLVAREGEAAGSRETRDDDATGGDS